MKFIKNLISVILARTLPDIIWYLATFSVIAAIVWIIGAISLWCGMPVVGSAPDMGNAITHVPQFDNGLALLQT